MTEKTFTTADLAKYDGSNGAKKYVAIDNVVYDVTDVPAWSGDAHHGNQPGQDLSERILKAPHKKSVLGKLTVVGKLEN